MAKPRNRPRSTETTHFEGVTPLWGGPNKPPIPEHFHAASMSLADWAGPNWSNNDATGFFPLRHFLIEASERWHAYDWQADEDLIASRRRDEKHRKTLAQATRAFRQAIGRSAFRRAERDLGISITSALCPNAQISMPYTDGCDAIARALRDFERTALRPDRFPVRFGPLLYDSLPSRLPSGIRISF